MADKRLNVSFSSSTYQALEELAEKKGTSMAEVLRDAIQLEKYVDDTRAEGGKILVERPDGKVRELVIR
jgi:predicted DNA-binding protein